MPTQIIPIQGLHTVGLIKDAPAVSLPPNAFSDALNIRFDSGAIHKSRGDELIFNINTRIGDNLGRVLRHVAWWANPNIGPTDGYYIVVATVNTTEDRVYAVQASDLRVADLDVTFPPGGDWQHTLYQGGYALILNNGLAKPVYILDETGNLDITQLSAFELPGWDSYHANVAAINDVYDPDIHLTEFDLGRLIDFDIEEVRVNVINGDTDARRFSNTLSGVGTQDQSTLTLDPATNTHIVTIATGAGLGFTEHLESGDVLLVNIRSTNILQVRAQVIRSWGDVLVAGGLEELNAPRISTIDEDENTINFSANHMLVADDQIFISSPSTIRGLYTIVTVPTGDTATVASIEEPGNGVIRYTIVSGGKAVRNQPGVVRISDLAPPGGIPHSWNPYSVGVNTAEEFTLSTTGIIRDLVELQGNLYVYTDSSIHAVTKTGNDSKPYIAATVSNSYGALSRDCVREFNGVHIVVGSNDVYQFSGHPASIKSIAADRVQDYLIDNLIEPDETFILLHRAENELWFNYTTTAGQQTLVWHYGLNTWSVRKVTNFTYGVIAPTYTAGSVDPSTLRPLFINGDSAFGGDYDTYTDLSGDPYESFFEKSQGALVPEFDVETLTSVALWADGEGSLQLRFQPTNYPGQVPAIPLTTEGTAIFTIGSDYKTDVRLNGRFLNYRITDAAALTTAWNISGIQLAVMKGGRR